MDNGTGWKGYFKGQDSELKEQQKADSAEWDATYAQEEEEDTFEYVQVDDKVAADDHWNDTDDIPTGQDPVGLA